MTANKWHIYLKEIAKMMSASETNQSRKSTTSMTVTTINGCKKFIQKQIFQRFVN